MQDIFISDKPNSDRWVIRTQDGSEISVGSAEKCYTGVLVGPTMAECSGALFVHLGDLDDRLTSVATNTKRGAAVLGLKVDGGSGRDKIQSGPLQDKVYGGPGNDTLFGMNGDDTLIGGAGDDKLYGLSGGDDVDGGTGDDTAYYPSPLPNVITLSDDLSNDGSYTDKSPGGLWGDRLRRVENIGGGQAGDSITGSAAANFLDGFRATTDCMASAALTG